MFGVRVEAKSLGDYMRSLFRRRAAHERNEKNQQDRQGGADPENIEVGQ
jgi:hypothetical protein